MTWDDQQPTDDATPAAGTFLTEKKRNGTITRGPPPASQSHRSDQHTRPPLRPPPSCQSQRTVSRPPPSHTVHVRCLCTTVSTLLLAGTEQTRTSHNQTHQRQRGAQTPPVRPNRLTGPHTSASGRSSSGPLQQGQSAPQRTSCVAGAAQTLHSTDDVPVVNEGADNIGQLERIQNGGSSRQNAPPPPCVRPTMTPLVRLPRSEHSDNCACQRDAAPAPDATSPGGKEEAGSVRR